MQVRVERFDEVSLNYEVDDIKIQEGGHLTLWRNSSGRDEKNWHLIGYINQGSWTAVFVLEEEKVAKLGLSSLS